MCAECRQSECAESRCFGMQAWRRGIVCAYEVAKHSVSLLTLISIGSLRGLQHWAGAQNDFSQAQGINNKTQTVWQPGLYSSSFHHQLIKANLVLVTRIG